MAITINGSGTIAGLSAGGLPSNSVTSATIANDAITADKIAAGAVGASEIADGSVGYSEIATDNQSFKYRGSFPNANNENFNTVQASGFYDIVYGSFSGTSNAPPTYGYGIMLVINAGQFCAQIYYPHFAGAASFRAFYVGSSWISWRTFG